MSVLNKIAAGLVAASVMAPGLAFAQTSTTTTNAQAVLAQIQALQAQIAALQAQYKLLLEQQNTAYQSLYQTLKEGSAGDQVAILQALLALDPSIYPEGRVTGFFGRLTAEAVKRYQKKHGIESLGLVGPKTLKKLNEEFGGFDDDEDDDDDDREKGKGRDKVTICHKGTTITVGAPAAYAHIKHGDTRGACGGGTGTTTPPVADTVAPLISNITVTGLASTTATIGWTTNEAATGKVSYGIAADLTGAATVSTTTLSTGHAFMLSGLTASTTYYYRLESKDAANNTATTSISGFTTVN